MLISIASTTPLLFLADAMGFTAHACPDRVRPDLANAELPPGLKARRVHPPVSPEH